MITRCAECLFFHLEEMRDGEGNVIPQDAGVCRRFPPSTIVTHKAAIFGPLNISPTPLVQMSEIHGWKVITTAGGMFPAVHKTWWCGEGVPDEERKENGRSNEEESIRILGPTPVPDDSNPTT